MISAKTTERSEEAEAIETEARGTNKVLKKILEKIGV